MELPFPLRKYHRCLTKSNWRSGGMTFENDLEFEAIYDRYIYATQCDLCDKVFPTSRDRHLDHCRDTNANGNIVCKSCNLRKVNKKIYSNNTSGYKGIRWHKGHNSWRFEAMVGGKKKFIKQMKDLDTLVALAEQWKIDNDYCT